MLARGVHRIFPRGGRRLVATLALWVDPFIFKSGIRYGILVICPVPVSVSV